MSEGFKGCAMGDRTGIEWTDATWNPIIGRTMANRIEAMSKPGPGHVRYSGHYAGLTTKVNGNPVWTGKLALAPDHILTAPLRWQKPRRIFVNSMGDLFHEAVPDEWIDKVFAIMALAPQHTFQVLTKRAKRMREYCGGNVVGRIKKIWLREFAHNTERLERGERPTLWTLPHGFTDRWVKTTCHPDCRPPCRMACGESGVMVRADKFDGEAIGGCECHGGGHFDGPVPWPSPNVWLGVSCEDQARADERILDLVNTPAAIRWISAEPLLGNLRLEHWLAYIDWIVVGGESGPGARPMHPEWARSIRDQCKAAGVPFLFKQWGEWQDADTALDGLTLGVIVKDGAKWTPDRPLNFEDATIVADIRSAKCECHTDGTTYLRLGKRRAGRLLDGVLHDEYPA